MIKELSQKYSVSDTGIAIAWLLRLPEKMQPIIGTTNPSRIKEIASASEVELTREDWYRVYRAVGYSLP